jgi:hypothetical protein
MSRETVYVKQCKGVNGLEKIILRENRGFSAEVSICLQIFNNIYIITIDLFFIHDPSMYHINFIYPCSNLACHHHSI